MSSHIYAEILNFVKKNTNFKTIPCVISEQKLNYISIDLISSVAYFNKSTNIIMVSF